MESSWLMGFVFSTRLKSVNCIVSFYDTDIETWIIEKVLYLHSLKHLERWATLLK